MRTPCTIRNGWMKIFNLGLYAVTLYDKFTGEGVRIFIDGRKLDKYDEMSNWLLKLKPKAEQNSEQLRQQIRDSHHLICSRETIKVRPEHLIKRSKGSITFCPLCREAYPSKHGEICRQCQGYSPYLYRKTLESEGLETPMLKSAKVEDAIGKKILHYMTRIIPSEHKGADFRRGQTITEGDICQLQQMGRYSLYVDDTDIDSGKWIHETTAGLSVDPEDLTLQGLLDAGATDLLYGAAVLPGAMTLLGRIGNVSLIGVPACALFHKTTSFDLLFPRLLADVPITRHDLAKLAHGGLCLECQTCSFPKCPFGK